MLDLLKKLFITTPFGWLIVGYMLWNMFYPKLREKACKWKVGKLLRKLGEDYKVVDGFGGNDFVVFSKYGIFVIKLVCCSGLVTAEECDRQWCEVLGKRMYRFENPFLESGRKVACLRDRFNMDVFIPIVCFKDNMKLQTKCSNRIIFFSELVDEVKRYKDAVVTEEVINKLLAK